MPFFLSSNFLTFSISQIPQNSRPGSENERTSQVGAFAQKGRVENKEKLKPHKSTRTKWLRHLFISPKKIGYPNFSLQRPLKHNRGIFHLTDTKKKTQVTHPMSWAPAPLRECLGIPRNPMGSCEKNVEKNREKKAFLGAAGLIPQNFSPGYAFGAKIHNSILQKGCSKKTRHIWCIYDIHICTHVSTTYSTFPQFLWNRVFFLRKGLPSSWKNHPNGPILQLIEAKIRHCALVNQWITQWVKPKKILGQNHQTQPNQIMTQDICSKL